VARVAAVRAVVVDAAARVAVVAVAAHAAADAREVPRFPEKKGRAWFRRVPFF
jgi:hypothetical protein